MPNSGDNQAHTPKMQIATTTPRTPANNNSTPKKQPSDVADSNQPEAFFLSKRPNPNKIRLENKTPETFEDNEEKKQNRQRAITGFLAAIPEVISLDFDQTITKLHSHYSGADYDHAHIEGNFAKNLFNPGDIEFWNDFFPLALEEGKTVIINSFQYRSNIIKIFEEAGIGVPKDLVIVGAENHQKSRGSISSKLKSLKEHMAALNLTESNAVHFDDDDDQSITAGFDQLFYNQSNFVQDEHTPSPRRFYKKSSQSQLSSEVDLMELSSAHEKLEISMPHQLKEEERAQFLYAQVEAGQFVNQIMSFAKMSLETSSCQDLESEKPGTIVALKSSALSAPIHDFLELTDFIEIGYRKELAAQQFDAKNTSSPFAFSPLRIKNHIRK